jgi:hypothetical protein
MRVDMTWSDFFKSNPGKYSVCTLASGLAIGTGITLYKASNMASECSAEVSNILIGASEDIRIGKFSAEFDFNNNSIPFALYNLNVPFPPDWTDRLDKLNELPVYCFSGPLTVGLCLTILMSFSIATYVMGAVYIKEEKENREVQRDYCNLPNV